jgi:hypothetical protein
MNLLWVLLAIFAYKFVDNLVKWFKCINLKDQYVDYLMTNNGVGKLLQSKKSVQDLILSAGVSDYKVPWTQPAGYGLVHTMQPSVLSQFPSRLEPFEQTTLRMFEEAIGVYKNRVWESLSPLYWINVVIWLPKRFLVYLGINDSNFTAKIINSLFQFLYWLAGLAFIAYNDEFKLFLLAIIERMKAALLN